MNNSPNSESDPSSTNHSQNTSGDTTKLSIRDILGGAAIGKVDTGGGDFHLTIESPQTSPATLSTESKNSPVELGENPYKGLQAFEEDDSHLFFGRDKEIKTLYKKFISLYKGAFKHRILPIYGASGSGKSSLARAGLVPKIKKELLKELSSVFSDDPSFIVFQPGERPLEELANELANKATHDPAPLSAKSLAFEEILRKNPDGLRRSANNLPNINKSPLIILVDQFEAIYAKDCDENDRNLFIENLLCATKDRSQHVSVIITMRIEFLGKFNQHPDLDALFTNPGYRVPNMQEEGLKKAITEPARQARYDGLNDEIVQLLLEQTKGESNSGALPLLQFALTEIWKGARGDIKPLKTLDNLGGVGGALAKRAKEIYEELEPDKEKRQQIARSIFLALIQLNDDNLPPIRRRVSIKYLTKGGYPESLIEEVIDSFAKTGAWILVTFGNDKKVEMVEIAHEVLISKWEELKEWLEKHKDSIRKRDKIEQEAKEWERREKSPDYLLTGRKLRDAKEFIEAQKDNPEISISSLTEFVARSQKKEKRDFIKKIFTLFIAPGILLSPLIFRFSVLSWANTILYKTDCQPDFQIKFFFNYFVDHSGKKELKGIQLCNEYIRQTKRPGINMPESNFEGANLSNSDFSHEAILAGSNFKGASVAYVDFTGSLLMGADFECSEKNKKCAYLWGTKFQKANLTKAKFKGADLTEANFDESKGMTENQLEGAKLCRTVIPKYLSASGDRDCPK